ncbi:hypothetical protein NL676_029945 [Syzygium grande]|nr:hypothetical protein NL676_029945 [Syzygium grande]
MVALVPVHHAWPKRHARVSCPSIVAVCRAHASFMAMYHGCASCRAWFMAIHLARASFIAQHRARASFMALLVPVHRAMHRSWRSITPVHRSWMSVMAVSRALSSFMAVHHARASCRAWFTAVHRAHALFTAEHRAHASFMAVLVLMHRAMHRSWPSVVPIHRACASFMVEHLGRESRAMHRPHSSPVMHRGSDARRPSITVHCLPCFVLVLVQRATHRSWSSIVPVHRSWP